jgi:DNA invertase Pin-like site-specific DNA recombinase
MIYGYARCSTNESKQDINRQIRELKNLGASDETIYLEYASGTKADRREFNKLLNIIVPGDAIVTTEVSRLSRSTKQLIELIDFIRDNKLKLIIRDSMTIDCTNGELDPMTKAFLQISGVFAELERDIISQRVKSGMQNAKAKGKVLGRPQTTADDIPSVFMKHYPKYEAEEINVTEFARLCSMSRTTIYKYLKLIENK